MRCSAITKEGLAVTIRRLIAAGLVTGAALVAPVSIAAGPTILASCPGGYYENVDSQCIPGPDAGGSGNPTAQCEDGSYSYSTHRSGTCSGHGGVAQWL
jgi:hypothetical protein